MHEYRIIEEWEKDETPILRYMVAILIVGALLILVSYDTHAALSDGVVSAWQWKYGANDFYNKNNGTLTGATLTNTSCFFSNDGCLNIGGTTQRMNSGVVGFPTGSADRTYSCWFKGSGTAGSQYMFSYGEQNPYKGFGMLESSQYYIWTHTDDLDTSVPRITGAWNLFTLTFVSSTKNGTLWINATNRASYTITNTNTGTANGNVIGASLINSGGYVGVYDDCIIWNRTLSSSEISQLYNSGAGTEVIFSGAAPPQQNSVMVSSPLNNSVVTSVPLSVRFNFSMTTVSECSLYTNITGIFSKASSIYADINYINDTTSVSFDDGTYQGTKRTGSSLLLNGSVLLGNYTSKIYDAGNNSDWSYMSWSAVGFDNVNLPNYAATESGTYAVNMTGINTLYHLDDSFSTVYDYSGYGYNATLYNSPSTSLPGMINNSVRFNYGSYAKTATLINRHDKAITVSFWVRLNNYGSGSGAWLANQRDGGSADQWQIFVSSDTKLHAYVFGNSGTNLEINDDLVFPLNTWVHIAMTSSGGTGNSLNLYRDGSLVKTGSLSQDLRYTDTRLVIGGMGWTEPVSSGLMNGSIDEFSIWNRSLSITEIINIYRRGMHTNFSVRSCDDNACSGEAWQDISDSSPQNIDVPENRYFQFKIEESTMNVSYSPDISAININSTRINSISPLSNGTNYTLNASFAANTQKTLSLIVGCYNGNETNSSAIKIFYNNTDLFPVTVSLVSINNVSFTNNLAVEHEDLTIRTNCTGDNVSTSSLMVSYSNGTVVQTSTFPGLLYETFVNHTKLGSDGNYSLYYYCQDDDGQNSSVYGNFSIRDLTMPILTWNSPAFDNTTVISYNSSLNLDIVASDLNLYSFDISCNDSMGVNKLLFHAENISSPYQFINTTDVITNLGVGRCVVIAKDKHTKQDITKEGLKAYSLSSEDSVIIQDKDSYSGVNITYSGGDCDGLVLEQEKDRYTFYPKLSNIPKEIVYYLSCDNGKLLYFDDKIYDGKNRFGKFFNCGDFWIDFHIEGVTDTKVQLLGGERARVSLTLGDTSSYKDVSSLKSRSVGVRNTLIEEVRFNVSMLPETESITETYSLPRIGILFVFFLVWIVCILIGVLMSSNPLGFLFGLSGCLIGIFLGIMFIPYSIFISYIFVFLNLFLIILGMWLIWNN